LTQASNTWNVIIRHGKIDACKRSTEVQQYIREQAIRLRLSGNTREAIAEIVGVHKTTVGNWITQYNKGGNEALEIGQRGRRTGEGRFLTKAQERSLQEMIIGKCPDQLQLPFALWSSTAIRALVKQMWGLNMSQALVSDYMQRWKYTPQKGVKRAYERSDPATQTWLEETYPEIKARAKQLKGEIFWGDETGISNQCQHARGYALIEKMPLLTTQSKRLRVNLISALNNQGKLRFMMYQETMTAKVLIRFMKRLIKDASRKVFLTLDNLRVHHAKLVKQWVADHETEIELYYLPAYTPDLNPDEYLNCDLKQGIHASSPARTQEQLEKKVLSHMRKVQALPDRIISYFTRPEIHYAAAGI
jgi:transposase